QRLGKNDERSDLHARLAGLRREQLALHADEIAEVEVLEDVKLFVAERLLLRVDLDAVIGMTATFEVHEHALAHVAMRRDAARDLNVAAVFQLARDIFRSRLAAADLRREFVREWIDALLAQFREIGFT